MFTREPERVFVLFAKPAIVAAMDDVNVVALANWFRFKMKSWASVCLGTVPSAQGKRDCPQLVSCEIAPYIVYSIVLYTIKLFRL